VCVRNAAMMYMDACHNPAGEGIAIKFITAAILTHTCMPGGIPLLE